MMKGDPIHPGEILIDDFLRPLGLSQSDLADHIGVPVQRINEIVRGRRGITPATAHLLGQAFDVPPRFWMDLQAYHDLMAHEPRRRVRAIAR